MMYKAVVTDFSPPDWTLEKNQLSRCILTCKKLVSELPSSVGEKLTKIHYSVKI